MAYTSLIPSVWEIPKAIRARMGERAGRQRLIAEDGHLLLVLHKPAKPDQVDREPALFWRKPTGEWLSDQAGGGLASLDAHLQSYARAIDECEQDEIRAKTADEYFSIIDRLAPLHRGATHMYQVLQEARKACAEDRALIDFRDRAYDLERRADLLYSGSKNALDYAVARRAEEQAVASQRMAVAAHRLNLLVAFFFPIATLAAVLGVNLTFPYRDVDGFGPFAVFVAVGLSAGILLTLLLFSPGKQRR